MNRIARAGVGWLVLLVAAVLNGALRQRGLIPLVGEPAGHVLSTLLLAGAILGATWWWRTWLQIESSRQAWAVGAGWLALTVAFEFLAGHFLFHAPWAKLFADYDLSRGRVWVLVLLATLVAPRLAVVGVK